MPKKKYVIFGGVDDYDNQPLFWNNDTGWGFLSTATKYTEKEYSTVSYLPRYGKETLSVWVEL